MISYREIYKQNDELMIRLYASGHLYDVPADEARQLANDILAGIEQREVMDEHGRELPELSTNAQRALGFIHAYMEMHRVSPSRQMIADHLGYADKKSLIPIMDELELKGWRRGRHGHRSDDWGGSYKRPYRPPFMGSFFGDDNPHMGDKSLVQMVLFTV